jgi:hypothetical protein
VNHVQTHLDAIGYNMTPAFYQVLDAHAIVPPKGEVVSFFNKDNIAELWLERTKLWPKQQEEATPQTSASQVAAQNKWFGYSLQGNSQGGRVLLCAISGQNCGLNATWSPGQTYPMVYLWENWLQTEKSPNIHVLVVRHGTSVIRLEKP